MPSSKQEVPDNKTEIVHLSHKFLLKQLESQLSSFYKKYAMCTWCVTSCVF